MRQHVRHARSVAIAVSLLLVVAAHAAAQSAYRDSPELPAGALGERLRQLVDVASSGSPDRVRALVENDFAPAFRDAVPLEEHLGLFASPHATSRGFDIHGVRSYDPPREDGNHVLIVRNRLTGGWQAFVVALEADPPHRFAGIRFSPARAPSDLPPSPPRTEEQIVAELEALLDRLVAADAFSGTVLLARGGGFPGISSNLDMFLDSGYVAVVLTNLDQAALPVQEAIRELLGSRVRSAPAAPSSTD